MPPGDNRQIRLPVALVERIEDYIATSDDGYTTVPEVVKTAVREFLDNHTPTATKRDLLALFALAADRDPGLRSLYDTARFLWHTESDASLR